MVKMDKLEAVETRGVSMTWRNLTIKVDIKTQHMFRNTTHIVKELIHNVNGYVKSKCLVAIMGASGSGKTTLMSALANRQSGDFKVFGDIKLNSQKIPPDLMKRISGFVYQDDLFVHTLTVSEHLHLAARIKLDRRISTKHRGALVDEILMDVGLTECANRFIGTSSDDDGKLNLSGGERKRLSVATELLINPTLLFCDEPTTGLDSYSALKLMTIMRNMTDHKNKTIICSIHQPSAKILDLFHQIILLHDGNIAFNGSSENALEFFQSIGYSYNKEQNPADYLIQSLSVVPGIELESIDRASEICLKFEESQYSKITCYQIDDQDCCGIEKLNGLENIEHISWFQKLYLITYREVLGIIRDPFIRYINFIKQMVIAVIIGVCMKKITVLDQESIQSIKGVLLSMVTEHFFPFIFITMWHFPRKIPIFMREYSNDMNTPLIFYLSNNISLLPGLLLDPILFTAISYSLLGLRNSWFAFLVTISVNVLVANISASYGILLSLATNNSTVADALATIVATLCYPFSGFTLNVRSLPGILSWVRYIYWVSYALEPLLIVYFQGVKDIQCSKTPDAPCLKTGEEVLHSMGFDSENLQRNMIVMCFIYLIFHLFSFIALKIRL